MTDLVTVAIEEGQRPGNRDRATSRRGVVADLCDSNLKL